MRLLPAPTRRLSAPVAAATAAALMATAPFSAGATPSQPATALSPSALSPSAPASASLTGPAPSAAPSGQAASASTLIGSFGSFNSLLGSGPPAEFAHTTSAGILATAKKAADEKAAAKKAEAAKKAAAEKAAAKKAAAEKAAADKAAADKAAAAKAAATPPPVNARLFNALTAAGTQLGTPYVYGGSTPGGFDCSGLVLWSMAHSGVLLPRTSRAQRSATIPISEAELQPGDLVFFGSPVHHVGIYVGGGNMIHAPRSGKTVEFAPIHRNGLSATSFGRIP